MTAAMRLPPAPAPMDQPDVLRPYRLPDGTTIPIFAVLAHSPGALADLRRATKACLDETELPIRWRELAILRVCALTGAEAEWSVHVTLFGEQARITEVELAATLLPAEEVSCWTDEEAFIVGAAEQLCQRLTVEDELWHELAKRLSARQLVELLTTTAQYHKVAMLTNALRVPVPDGLPRFPAPPTEPCASPKPR